MTEFVKKCHMLLKGLLHFDWHIRIELPWWSPIKRWRAMSHQGHALRQIFVDENWEIVVQKKYAEDDNEDGWFLLIYVTETKCKKYNRRIYTLYSDMGNTDLHRYVLVHFQIDVNYKYTATPHENRKKSRKSYFKTMSSTIECLKKSASSKKPKSAYTDIMGKVEKTT